MADQERRNSNGRRSGKDRRKSRPGIISFFLEYDGPDRRAGTDRRTGLDRRQ